VDRLTGADIWRTGPPWSASDRPLARWVARPLASFLRVEAAGGLVLLVATVAALAWANSPWRASYDALWGTEGAVRLGPLALAGDLRHWVNDALMAVFFFTAALEIKWQLAMGELRSPRAAAVPVLAAAGGMAVPALIYVLLNRGGPTADGWGIPMATDIAFAVGVLTLLGSRVPAGARIFLLTLAIADDIGAIVVIALHYASELSGAWLATSLVLVAVLAALRRLRVWAVPVYLTLGLALWVAVYSSGVHPTVAGVVLGLLAPARPLLDPYLARRQLDGVADDFTVEDLRRCQFLLGESVSVAERLVRSLHPWSSYVILPVFALANAGIFLGGGAFGAALESRVTLSVVLALVLGKVIGITGATWLATRLGIGTLPRGTGWPVMVGVSALAGIGFTVSIFITGLAFGGSTVPAVEAKVGVLVASFVAAVLGTAVLLVATRRQAPESSAAASGLTRR
jgi:NhaA family Na+:H+ antiporter